MAILIILLLVVRWTRKRYIPAIAAAPVTLPLMEMLVEDGPPPREVLTPYVGLVLSAYLVGLVYATLAYYAVTWWRERWGPRSRAA